MTIKIQKKEHKIIDEKETKLKEIENGAWRVFGRTYPKLSLGMKELIDNAISALLLKKDNEDKRIYIKFKEVDLKDVKDEGFKSFNEESDGFTILAPSDSQIQFDFSDESYFLIEIHDNGCGIESFEKAMRIGKALENKDLSTLNEHGVGLKNALAFANIENNAWEIMSRDEEDVNQKRYKYISSPYKSNMKYYLCEESGWHEQSQSTGTIIRFLTKKEVFLTIGATIEEEDFKSSNAVKNFIEDIGVTYSKKLKKKDEINKEKVKLEIEFISREGKLSNESRVLVEPNIPEFEQELKSREKIGLNNKDDKEIGEIIITEGFIKPKKGNKHFYLASTKSPRVFVYLNGRLIANLWETLFKEKNHNRFNRYYLEVNINIQNRNFIPSTNATKTSFVSGDKKYKSIIQHIKKAIPLPRAYEEDLSERERKNKFVKRLEEREKSGEINGLIIRKEYAEAFDELGKADLFVHYVKVNTNTLENEVKNELYEFKKTPLNLKSVFQLIGYTMYMRKEDYELTDAILVVDDKSFLNCENPEEKDYIKSKKLMEFIDRFEAMYKIKISIKTYDDEDIKIKTVEKKLYK